MDTGLMNWEKLLDERQLKEVQLCRLYAAEFHHGTTGHNQLMLIAFLATALDRAEEAGTDFQKLFEPKPE